MAETMSFHVATRAPGVTGHRNPPGTLKPWTIAHENGQECPKSRVFTMPLEPCTWGHGALKSSRDPKTMDYSPRKRPEMPEIASFFDTTRVVYRGSRGFEIFPGPKNVDYSPRKRPEMPEIAGFYDATRVVYRGSQGFEIFPGPKNRGL